MSLGAKYRVTHDSVALLNSGWIGVIPVVQSGDDVGGGLVPKNYLQLPETYARRGTDASVMFLHDSRPNLCVNVHYCSYLEGSVSASAPGEFQSTCLRYFG